MKALLGHFSLNIFLSCKLNWQLLPSSFKVKKLYISLITIWIVYNIW